MLMNIIFHVKTLKMYHMVGTQVFADILHKYKTAFSIIPHAGV